MHSIVFICSCLEPGCDGVGDYTKMLAESCLEKGLKVTIIALNDRFLAKNPNKRHYSSEGRLNQLRFKNAFTDEKSKEVLRKYIESAKPDIISLQYVPYGYHHKGFTGSLGKKLRDIAPSTPFHIMFHEIWIGFSKQCPLKNKLIGCIQKKGLKKTLKSLEPVSTHTHTNVYKKNLKKLGLSTNILPLFGHIKRCEPIEDESWFYPKLQKLGINIEKNNRDSFALFGIFGTFHPNWPAYPLLQYIEQYANQNKKTPILLHLGHIGSGKKHWAKTKETSSIEMHAMGPLLSSKIWTIFRDLDYGVATSPFSLITKSASATAMLETGLPVIVNRVDTEGDPDSLPANKDNPLLIKMTEDLPFILNKLLKQDPQNSITSTTSQFLSDLRESLDT